MLVDALYLREKAHYCVALARRCPHLWTAQALEALGTEMMEKAAEWKPRPARYPHLEPTKPPDEADLDERYRGDLFWQVGDKFPKSSNVS